MKKYYWIPFIILLFSLLLLAGCGPSESEAQATITQIALNIIGTQTAQAPTPTLTPTLAPGQIRQSEMDGMNMVFIPSGEYILGSTEEDIKLAQNSCLEFMDSCEHSSWEDELPQHTAQLDDFWIDMHEVSVAMFRKFVDETGYETDAERFQYSIVFYGDDWDPELGANWAHPQYDEDLAEDNNPVVNVSWYDAWAYCKWAGRRLPTEAEWEAAARGTDLRLYPWGDDHPNNDSANLADNSLSYSADWRNSDLDDGYEYFAPVDSFPQGASSFGVMNMGGNIREWVFDLYAEDYSYRENLKNPVNLSTGEDRVVRGGGYGTIRTAARTAARFGRDPYYSSSDYGFRCVSSAITLPDPPERNTPIPEIALVNWRVEVKDYEESGSFNELGYLKSFEELDITGQYNNCRYVRISTPEFPAAWIYVNDDVVLYRDCSDIEEIFLRPASNSWKIGYGGSGKLEVSNQGEMDAVVILKRVDPPHEEDEEKHNYQHWMYIRAGESATMEFISNGSYQVYLTTGLTWMPTDRRFRDAPSYEQLKDPLEFTATETTYSQWSLVIESGDGNTGSQSINESAFPE